MGRFLSSSLSKKKSAKATLIPSATNGDSNTGKLSINGNNNPTAAPGASAEDGGRTNWDLQACVSAIETMKDLEGLSPHQREAIRNLRAAATDGMMKKDGGSSRGAGGSILGGMSRTSGFLKDTLLFPVDVLKSFNDVQEDKDDEGMKEAVDGTLAQFGLFGWKEATVSRSVKKGKNVGVVGASFNAMNKGVKDSVSVMKKLGTLPTRRASTDVTPGSVVSGKKQDQGSKRNVVANLDEDKGACSESAESVPASPQSPAVSEINSKHCPPEWNALTKPAKIKLAKLLSWEKLSHWDYDIVEVADQTREVVQDSVEDMTCFGQLCPLLFVGWAVLCSPHAQEAMRESLGDDAPDDACAKDKRAYNFVDSLDVDPAKICNYLRALEGKYNSKTPYHNNTHAADVLQTLHCFVQFIEPDHLSKLYDPLQLFSILLAAAFHDVGHQGVNNLFEKKTAGEFAVVYNDESILENMHSAVGHSLLMGKERKEEWDIFEKWSSDDRLRARAVMVSGVLGTDMSHHFKHMGELASRVTNLRASSEGEETVPVLSLIAETLDHEGRDDAAVDKEKVCRELADDILNFFLHSADISNPTKHEKMCVYWADKALTEFFAQGDKERELGLSISPLCDRHTVKRPDSQIGFLNFVVKPCYKFLGEILPKVNEEVLPIIESNLAYWKVEKSEMRKKAIRNTLMAAKAFHGKNGDD